MLAVCSDDPAFKNRSNDMPNALSQPSGIFPCQILRAMTQDGQIAATEPLEPDQIQPASMDLRLGPCAYPVSTSFLPGMGVNVLDKMRQLDPQIEDYKIALTGEKGALLEKGRVYVIPLMESLRLDEDTAAFANPKSSTGRLDILTRLITDSGAVFDQVEQGYVGKLYLEVAPRSFSVVARAGTRLNQLRFKRAGESAGIAKTTWQRLLETGQIVAGASAPGLSATTTASHGATGVLPFTVDLQGSGQPGDVIGWRAKENAGRIDLDRRDCDPLDFWEPIALHRDRALILDPNRFYILMTREAIGVPADFAAEMLPYDTRAGEFRVHYAGFFDPGFGWNPSTQQAGGSRGVLEVRSHEVPFLLEHGQMVGWLRYEPMAAKPDCLYGRTLASNYQGQGLKLAKQFAAQAA